MYTVAVRRDLIARHYLIGGDWGAENNPHSHHYIIEVRLKSAELDQHGYLVDIVKIEAELQAIIDYFGESMLNDLPEFEGLNPSIEHFSQIICSKLLTAIAPPGSGQFTARIWENDSCWAAYSMDY
jgi:6-pyruvoyltetrahydropterin/6-carboxytetrahydropterin synthase|tara:strand:- start:10190 stop:10567 length:378 start_codon:yes stop_codon:yes gene_type:complete